MIAIGLVLLVLALIVGAGVVFSNDQLVSAEAFGVSVNDISLGVFFLLGAAVGAVVLLGLALMIAGAARSRAKKKAIREEAEGSRERHESLAEQNARLQAELEASRGTDGSRGVDGDRNRDGDRDRDPERDTEDEAMRDRTVVAAAPSPTAPSVAASSQGTSVQERPVTPARRDSGEPTWSPTTSPGAAPTTGPAGSTAPAPGVAAGTGPAAAAAPVGPAAGAAPTPTVLPADSSDSGSTSDDGPGKHVATDSDGHGHPDRD